MIDFVTSFSDSIVDYLQKMSSLTAQEAVGATNLTILLAFLISVFFGVRWLLRHPNSSLILKRIGQTQLALIFLSIPVILQFVEVEAFEASIPYSLPLILYYVSFMLMNMFQPEVFVSEESYLRSPNRIVKDKRQAMRSRRAYFFCLKISFLLWLVSPVFPWILGVLTTLGLNELNLGLASFIMYGALVFMLISVFSTTQLVLGCSED